MIARCRRMSANEVSERGIGRANDVGDACRRRSRGMSQVGCFDRFTSRTIASRCAPEDLHFDDWKKQPPLIVPPATLPVTWLVRAYQFWREHPTRESSVYSVWCCVPWRSLLRYRPERQIGVMAR